MKSIRTLAAAAASVAIAGTLIAGLAGPADAATATFPPPGPPSPIGTIGTIAHAGPITPQYPGPNVPHITPGTIHPVPLFPSCATQLQYEPSHYYAAVLTANRPGAVGTAVPALARIAAATRNVTCSYLVDGTRVIVTEAAITPDQYRTLRAWYETNTYYTRQPGPMAVGTPSDLILQVGDPVDGLPAEGGMLSSDGWWITIYDGTGFNLNPFRDGATIRLLQADPWLS